jgi:hypothetical protein
MSLFSVLSVGASGMQAQRVRAELLVENLANAETTRTPEGGPYRRKDAVFESTSVSSPFSSIFESQVNASGGVAVSQIVTDNRLRSLSEDESGGRHGGPDGRLAQLPGQRGRHLRGQRHDPALHRAAELSQ